MALFPLAQPGTNTHAALDISASGSTDYYGGQYGMVSALAPGQAPAVIKHEWPGEQLEIIAIGTFSNNIGIYISESLWLQSAMRDLKENHCSKLGTSNVVPGASVCLCGWQLPEGRGVTQVRCKLIIINTS
jgi:hypothetical protein